MSSWGDLMWYDWLVLGLYGMFMLFIFFYSLAQLHLVFKFLRKKPLGIKNSNGDLPLVTIQLPIYNERYVVERLIDSVMAMDYPKNLFEVQILDDSSDETSELARISALKWFSKGFGVVHLKRPHRIGFKAGALSYGLHRAKGEFIAIFDADFIPDPNFLLDVVPHFANPKVAMVQTRWGHLNRGFSFLTEMQAFGLDAHFTIEQSGRSKAGSFINFNGTAGVWRKQAIEQSGGWSSDTLTEDLDLSYRAQMKGWEFIYLSDVVSPAELPVSMSALKTQQFRWTKGAAECAVKNLRSVWRADDLSLRTKIHGHFHLMNSSIFIYVLSIALLSIPLLFIRNKVGDVAVLDALGVFFALSILILFVFYYVSYTALNQTFKLVQFVKRFIIFLSMSMGMSLHNSIAVLEGYVGKKTPFVRTPKFSDQSDQNSWRKNVYLRNTSFVLLLAEAFFSLLFAAAIFLGVYFNDYALMPFHAMLSAGFGIVAFYGARHSIV